MNFRTDLVLERRELVGEAHVPGVNQVTREKENAKITEIQVQTEEGAQAIGKPIGKYITVEVPNFANETDLLDGRLNAIADELKSMLPTEGCVLVVGLGNNDITPDALGPKCVSQIFATRHIGSDLAMSIGLPGLRAVAALTPGVLGQTGMETSEIVAAVVERIRPTAVIAIDALAARRLSRLGNTVQMSDTGVSPGSGVGNARTELSEKTLGVKVISMGVPTVVDAVTLVTDVLGEQNAARMGDIRIDQEFGRMMVTPREIDLMTERAAKLIALSINTALQPSLSLDDILSLI